MPLASQIMSNRMGRMGRNRASEDEITFQRQALSVAQSCLAQAENTIIGVSRKNRVRMRFALERAKVNEALAELAESPAEIRRYLSYAKHDLEDLKAKTAQSKLLVWKMITFFKGLEYERTKKNLDKRLRRSPIKRRNAP